MSVIRTGAENDPADSKRSSDLRSVLWGNQTAEPEIEQVPSPGSLRFEIGHISVTAAAELSFAATADSASGYLLRHQRGDWGLLDSKASQSNEKALREGGPIRSVYLLENDLKIVVVTAGSRQRTRIFLISEY